jgi:hypothetical protein
MQRSPKERDQTFSFEGQGLELGKTKEKDHMLIHVVA